MSVEGRISGRSRTRALAVLVAVVGGGSLFAATAWAGMFDYTLSSVPPNTWSSRSVPHDYSYLRGSTGGSVSLQRNASGTIFTSSFVVDHHYADPCNPASCYSWYKQGTGSSQNISVHDEWR